VGDANFVIAATGLAAEARIAARSGNVTAVAAGGDEARLIELIEHSLVRGARGIISFGIAGGLRPGFAPGTCIVGTNVNFQGQSYPVDAQWSNRIAGILSHVECGTVAGTRLAIAEPSDKKALHDATGAISVDMESHVVARIATERGLPFAILRVIADPADQRLPPAAANGLKPDGRPDVVAVVKSLSSEPGQLPDLLRIAIYTRRAMASLFRCHRLLGPGLGFVDLS
jgi:adenosylhomocysteine nucleosidase